MYNIDLIKIKSADSIPQAARELYFGSFPEEERRPWADIERRVAAADPFFNLYVLQHKNENVGFVTLWNLPGNVYVEHFAIGAEHRGSGFGADVVRRLTDADGLRSVGLPAKPLLLEVELPEVSEEARRRVGFYTRNGLVALDDVPYFQPPYTDGLPDVPMMLMASERPADPVSTARVLHTIVYNQ